MRHGLIIALMALACGVCQTDHPLAPPMPEGRDTKPTENKDVNRPAEMCPVGLAHDFGKVQTGTIAKHTFRFVNTSDNPLQVIDLRCTPGPLVGRSTKNLLQPHEEGEVEISLDTRRFRGHKTRTLYMTLRTDNGKSMIVIFRVSADSQEQ